MMQASQSSKEREFSFSEKEFHFLANLANKRTGIMLEDHKKDMVYSRLVRRLRALKLKSFAEYCDLVQSSEGTEEMGNLINAITTNLTRFFREEHHFEHLYEQITHTKEQRLRIWSAGCSAGMEPYSIAMTVRAATKKSTSLDVKILATDIDTNMLTKGREGHYPFDQLDHIPRQYHSDITSDEDSIYMSDILREMIAFKPLNLLESWPMNGPFDVVFCRNVVIYFDKPTQAKLFNRIADLLKPDGWLYIGHSENLFKVSDRFELVGRTIYRKVR
jgi:chemotaxis protein methyltransferase CheR